jgi:hypothetical protein
MLIKDTNWRIRYEVAHRAELDVIGPFLADDDPLVRERARERFTDTGVEPPSNVVIAQTRSDK